MVKILAPRPILKVVKYMSTKRTTRPNEIEAAATARWLAATLAPARVRAKKSVQIVPCTSTRHGRACPGHGDSDSEVFCGFPRTGNGSVTPLAYPIATPLSKRNKLRGGCIPRRKTLRDAHSHTTSKFCRLRDAVREHDDYGRIVLVRPAGAPRD